MSKVDIFVQESEKAFKAEDFRRDILDKKAEKFFAIIALIAALHLLDIKRLSFSSFDLNLISSVLAVVAFVLLGLSLVYTIQSVRVRPYRSYPRGTKLRDELEEESITDDDAKIKFGLFYLEAHDLNASINDKRAELLSKSSCFLLYGFILAVVSHILSKIVI